MPDRVPESLSIDDDLRAGRERYPDLGRWVEPILPQNEERLGIVAEVEEGAHDPPRTIRVEAVVVVLVKVVDRIRVVVGLQFDHSASPDVGARFLRPLGKQGCFLGL